MVIQRPQLLGNPLMYGRFQSGNRGHAKVKERYQDILSILGVQQVITGIDTRSGNVIISSISEQNRTLFILPRFEPASEADSIITINGFSYLVYKKRDFPDTKEITYHNKVIGTVFQNGSIILWVNPFPPYPKINPLKNFVLYFSQAMGGARSVPVPPKKTQEELIQINADRFYQNIDKTIMERKRHLIDNERRIERAQTEIMEALNQSSSISAEITGLESAKGGSKEMFLKKFSELTDLKVVEKIELQEDGIFVDFGEITIKYQSEDYYIGKITGKITPNAISFRNTNNSRDGYTHPHISGSACFGTYSTDIYRMLSALDLKRLIFTLAQYLRTYNNKSPYHHIAAWKKK